MAHGSRNRELGRGERVLPGAWRLRLALPWPGVPHCNAWAIAAGDGIVLFDTGMHEPGSMAQLERALAMCGWALEDVRLVVCTHAHADHYGQAATILARTGCELWMHPRHEHATAAVADPAAALAHRVEVARQSGVPAEPLRRYAVEQRSEDSGIAALVPPSRPLLGGEVIETDLGPWIAHETPGHAPSHVCFFQPQRRILISGDHLLGRVSLYFDYGWSPDPVGEFLSSLERVDALDARLCLAGHGRTFTDVRAHVVANQRLVAARLQRAAAAIADRALTAFEVVPYVHDGPIDTDNAAWWLQETLCYLTHLEAIGQARCLAGEPQRWRAQP